MAKLVREDIARVEQRANGPFSHPTRIALFCLICCRRFVARRPGGWDTKIIGSEANKNWHYQLDGEQPSRLVRWYARFYTQGEPTITTIINLWHRFNSWRTGKPPPWVTDTRKDDLRRGRYSVRFSTSTPGSPGGDARVSTATPRVSTATPRFSTSRFGGRPSLQRTESLLTAEGQELAEESSRERRRLAAAGLIGIFLTWAIFAWCVPTHSRRVPGLGPAGASRAVLTACLRTARVGLFSPMVC